METKQIAYAKAGSFKAWFDQVNGGFTILCYDGDSETGFVFNDIESAKEKWHKDVIDRKGFKHCYCC
jgi:hypothetical protein